MNAVKYEICKRKNLDCVLLGFNTVPAIKGATNCSDKLVTIGYSTQRIIHKTTT